MLFLHTRLPVLAALAGLAVIAYALWGTAKKRPHDKVMKKLAITFRTFMDLSAFLGLVLVFTNFGFNPDLGIHIFLMLLATAVSHVVPAVMRRRRQADRTLPPYAVATAISLGLAVVGVLVVPGIHS
jgi:L-asparagine transporter-like permease